MEKKITIVELFEAKREGRKIAAVSCYDFTTARLIAQTDVEMLLVGDSAAQIALGFDSTLPVTMDYMVTITAGVRRGAPNVYLVADMPFLSYQIGISEAVKNAGRFFAEAGAQMVKIEVHRPYLGVIKAVSDAGMAVMGHIGIRPQSVSKVGQFKAEATTAEMGLELIAFADEVIEAGASALLLEAVAAEVAEVITNRSEVPVIGCGSGAGCDGQILVVSDILGLTERGAPKFAKSYGDLGSAVVKAFAGYAKEIKQQEYPDRAHSYHMKAGELERLQQLLKAKF